MNSKDATEILTQIEAQNRQAVALTPAEFWMRANQKLDQLETDNPAVLFVSIPELPVIETGTLAIDIQSLGQPLLATAVDSSISKPYGTFAGTGMETTQLEPAVNPTPTSGKQVAPQIVDVCNFNLTSKQPSKDIDSTIQTSEKPTETPIPKSTAQWDSANQWSVATRSVDFSGLELSLLQTGATNFDEFKKFRELHGQIFLFCDAEAGVPADLTAYCAMKDLLERYQEPVLWIDAQLDRAGVSEVLGTESTEGWAEVVKLEKPWQTAILPSNLPRAYFLAPGVVKLRTQSAGNFFAPRMLRLTQELQQHFRFVIISCGTAFDSGISAWARYCDQAYLTLDPSSASRSLTKAAIEQLRQSNARVAGIVVTQQPQVA